jgi:4-carboxymuconolactone decarboxylase
MSLYRTNELAFMKRALKNGITKDEIIATITHLAFMRVGRGRRPPFR